MYESVAASGRQMRNATYMVSARVVNEQRGQLQAAGRRTRWLMRRARERPTANDLLNVVGVVSEDSCGIDTARRVRGQVGRGRSSRAANCTADAGA